MYKKRLRVRAGESLVQLTTWAPGSTADARSDIAKRYSQRPDGFIVDQEMARLAQGKQVTGLTFQWSVEIPPHVEKMKPWTVCPSCDFRTPDDIQVCPACQAVIRQAVLV